MSNQLPCVHCGSDCGNFPVKWNNQNFCCNGCVQVYKLLHENRMGQYYTLRAAPGLRIDDEQYGTKYAWLDKPEVQAKLYEFFENNIAKVTLHIPSIHCVSCIWLLEHLNKLNPGIKYSSVNFINKTLTASFDTTEITLRQLIELLVSIHYIPEINLQSIEPEKQDKTDKHLMYRIGVAGFAFGNVMLYSLPEYFNGAPLNEALGVFLYYLGFILTIPVVFYSGSDYILSGWKNIRKGLVNIDLPIAIGIITLFLVTSFDVFTGRGPGYSDSLAGFMFFLLLGRWYQNKTYQALSFDRDYKSYFPVAVTKLSNNDTETSILLDEVVPGNRLLIRNKELIPADAQLISGHALIDYSFVTGESNPVAKAVGEPLYAGGIQTGGAIVIEILTEVKQSHLTELWNQNNQGISNKSKLISAIDHIAVYFTIAIIAIALVSLAGWWVATNFGNAILVLTSVLIVACPCALSMSLPFTYGSAMRVLGQHGVYLKNTGTLEKIKNIDTIVFDKTGTLTKPNEQAITFSGEPLSETEIQYIVSLVRQSVHPLSFAIAKKFAEIPALPVEGFVEMAGRGIFGKTGGFDVMVGSASFIGAEISATTKTSQVFVSFNGSVRGSFDIQNKYRDGFNEVISQLSSHYNLYVLSGDNNNEMNTLASHFNSGNLIFNQTPRQKQQFIASLQKNGHKVLMVGDGLNDAGAFLQSDASMSLADDVYHFTPACDAIVEAGRFNNFFNVIRFIKSAGKILYFSFAISLIYNIVGLTVAISGHLSPVIAAILMPLSSITVVAFATLATRLSGRKML